MSARWALRGMECSTEVRPDVERAPLPTFLASSSYGWCMARRRGEAGDEIHSRLPSNPPPSLQHIECQPIALEMVGENFAEGVAPPWLGVAAARGARVHRSVGAAPEPSSRALGEFAMPGS